MVVSSFGGLLEFDFRNVPPGHHDQADKTACHVCLDDSSFVLLETVVHGGLAESSGGWVTIFISIGENDIAILVRERTSVVRTRAGVG